MDSSHCGAKTHCDCGPPVSRRELLQFVGACAGTLGLAHLGSAQVVRLETREDFEKLIPADKGLDSQWRKALVQRGAPEVFRGWEAELKYVGMPIGGVGCGQLYLGGDGRLWLWDIFKCNYRREPDHGQRIDAFTLGGHYANPVAFDQPYTRYNGADVVQGFAVKIDSDQKSIVRSLDHVGFPGVAFRGEYPIGKVRYQDDDVPVVIALEAFSPFIPLNAKDSALPATVMSFQITNESEQSLEVELVGWLQNATCPYVTEAALGMRRNQIVVAPDCATLLASLEPTSPGSGAGAEIERRHGYGSMALALINASAADSIAGAVDVAIDGAVDAIFAELTQLAPASPVTNPTEKKSPEKTRLEDAPVEHAPVGDAAQDGGLDLHHCEKRLDEKLVGALSATLSLEPGASKSIDFAVTWYFPDFQEVDRAPGFLSQLQDFSQLRRHYAPWFASAAEVAAYLSANQNRLLGETRLWNRTWYDSTLPHWFLDRTFLSIDCAATHVFHWFDSGRAYGWEGVDCCPGTCTHVWHYAQGLGRIFPELERAFREITDYGIAFHDDTGMIGYRAESHDSEATDGQAGTILRAYREHQMSPDHAFLRRLWPKIKKSIEFLIAKDPDHNGLLEGAQPHTLDAAWYGPMAWVSGLYLAALAAGQAMAAEMGDATFEQRCRQIVANGRVNIVAELFDGEYFIHRPDPNMPSAIRTGKGCHIDQVLGQAWAHQVGLPRVFPQQETISALQSLWRYNFAADAGSYAVAHRAIEQAFRWYAMRGEAGLLMCTWPKGGAEEAIPGGNLRPATNPDVWTGPGGYFNECMNGFEYQVAAHMIHEGRPGDDLVEKGLAITRAIHERYAPAKRNPYNEIECSDHYARSMASYGVFLAACGFEYHGPQGRIGFSPRVSPDDFRAPFTCAEGWGTFSQRIDDAALEAQVEVRWGRLLLNRFAVALPANRTIGACEAKVGDVVLTSSFLQNRDRVETTFAEPLVLNAGSMLRLVLT